MRVPVGTWDTRYPLRSELLSRTALKTASYTAVAGELVQFDLSGASADVTLTLPATPTAGQQVGALLTSGHATYNLIVALNSSAFRGGTQNIRCWDLCMAGDLAVWEFIDSTTGWIPVLDRIMPHRAKLRRDVALSNHLQIGGGLVSPIQWDTIEEQIGCGASVSTHAITPRRLGRYRILQQVNAAAVPDNTRLVVLPAGPSNVKSYPDNFVRWGAASALIAGGTQTLSVSKGTAITTTAQLVASGVVGGTQHAMGANSIFEVEEVRG